MLGEIFLERKPRSNFNLTPGEEEATVVRVRDLTIRGLIGRGIAQSISGGKKAGGSVRAALRTGHP